MTISKPDIFRRIRRRRLRGRKNEGKGIVGYRRHKKAQ